MTTATEATRHSLASDMMDVWLQSYKTAFWGQEQLEALATGWMSQARTMRHDGQKVLEVMVSQAQQNADEATRVTESMVHKMMAAVPAWDAFTSADLRRQVADLSARVETLSASK
jgi:polyhydroxyalkanoate synthesis regulator phasin